MSDDLERAIAEGGAAKVRELFDLTPKAKPNPLAVTREDVDAIWPEYRSEPFSSEYALCRCTRLVQRVMKRRIMSLPLDEGSGVWITTNRTPSRCAHRPDLLRLFAGETTP